jgi:NADPH2:quinone reductase
MDAEMIKGSYGGFDLSEFAFGGDFFPHIMGVEGAGIVDSVGGDVSKFESGDRVVGVSHFTCGECKACRTGQENACAGIEVIGIDTPGLGTYAEYISLPEWNWMSLPENVSFEAASATVCNPFGTAWQMLRRAELEQGETVLVTGASGGVGHAVIQVAKHAGADVIGTTTTKSKMDFIREQGADEVILLEDKDFGDDVIQANDGEPVEVVADVVGDPTWDGSIDALQQRGRLVSIGGHGGLMAEVNVGDVFGKLIDILGNTRAPKVVQKKVLEMVADGTFEPAVTESYSLTELPMALDRIESDEHVGRIAIVP